MYALGMARVFLGIPLSKELQAKVATWQTAHQNLPVRWVLDKNIHITLVPPWEESDFDGTLEKLELIKNEFKKFTVQFDWIGLGPSLFDPRLIWAYGKAPIEINKLAKTSYLALGLQPPEREFRLHATLARFSREDFVKFSDKKIHEPANWKMNVEKITLFESHLGPSGADYTSLGEIKLQKTSSPSFLTYP